MRHTLVGKGKPTCHMHLGHYNHVCTREKNGVPSEKGIFGEKCHLGIFLEVFRKKCHFRDFLEVFGAPTMVKGSLLAE